jgi:hypothetical protein
MATIQERVYIDAPYSQAADAFERRLGLGPGTSRGTCVLTLAFPIPEGREIARVVTATAERLSNAANYASRYAIGWPAGATPHGIPTPGFEGVVALSAGEDYGETTIQLDGHYEPPGGVAGRAFDGVLGQRIAHATLGALLNGVGEELRAAHERTEADKSISS